MGSNKNLFLRMKRLSTGREMLNKVLYLSLATCPPLASPFRGKGAVFVVAGLTAILHGL